MADNNYYDVTQWPEGNPYKDVGQVINSIIGDIKSRQGDPDLDQGGKPGAVIYIPPGDYHLTTQVVIDISYLKIAGSGHGFTSSSIRFNTPEREWADWHELWILPQRKRPGKRPGQHFMSSGAEIPGSARWSLLIFVLTACILQRTVQATGTRKTHISMERPGSILQAPRTPSGLQAWDLCIWSTESSAIRRMR